MLIVPQQLIFCLYYFHNYTFFVVMEIITSLFSFLFECWAIVIQYQFLTKTLVLQAAHARDFSHGLAALIQVSKRRL